VRVFGGGGGGIGLGFLSLTAFIYSNGIGPFGSGAGFRFFVSRGFADVLGLLGGVGTNLFANLTKLDVLSSWIEDI
jgi:hypothetical protein